MEVNKYIVLDEATGHFVTNEEYKGQTRKLRELEGNHEIYLQQMNFMNEKMSSNEKLSAMVSDLQKQATKTKGMLKLKDEFINNFRRDISVLDQEFTQSISLLREYIQDWAPNEPMGFGSYCEILKKLKEKLGEFHSQNLVFMVEVSIIFG
jgi:hypothetical protein